jgi:phenylalanyl-tRNA synthetase beta chain
MKFSYQWLRDLVPSLDIEPAELQRLITMKTAECEGIETVGAHFESVVAVRVLSAEYLPKGKNKRVTVDTGSGEITVVCGAPNVIPGMLAPWVKPGTKLGTKLISRATIEGVESEGMLASASELGINRDHSGLLVLTGVEPGTPLPDLKPDSIIEIDNKSLTHRPDLWGHYGMAREVAAITGKQLRDPVSLAVLPASNNAAIKISIADSKLCPRYSLLVMQNAHVEPSPLWLQARLESVGLNAISNLVDVTNYVLAELPQPMHAFDADKIAGDTIFVRLAQPGEKLEALNGETYELTVADLVIADDSGPIALAGVIGGAQSAISKTTTRIILESANFNASSVRLSSARHKLRTDASMRFEKSLDPENTIRGLARAVQLLQQLSPGIEPVGGVADSYVPLPEVAPIILPPGFLDKKLGQSLPQPQITSILHALGFGVSESEDATLTVTVPSWRATKDISMKADLVEEIGRMVGYDSITPAPPLVASTVPPSNPLRLYLRKLRSQLVAQGFSEAHNYSFVTETAVKRFGLNLADHIAVRNPIASELTHLRRGLLPGLFNSILNNVRYQKEFRLFEIGNEIHPQPAPQLPSEIPHLAAVLYTALGDEQDFFELKRVAECAFPGARLTVTNAAPYEHPARAAEIQWRGKSIGRLFELHPSLFQAEGIEGRAFLFDVDLRLALELEPHEIHYKPLRKYPTSDFDLSLITHLKAHVDQIRDELTLLAGKDLVLIEFVGQYFGSPLQPGQKSVTYHLKIGALDHTLTAEEGTSVRNRIIDGMIARGYEFRGLADEQQKLVL